MIEGRILWDKLKEDICKNILNNENNLIFLIGDNSSGKSEIGELLKDEITVLDNYTGEFKDIPKDKKTLVITHKVNLLLNAKSTTPVIITRYNDLYVSTDCDFNSYGDILNKMQGKNTLSILLNNAVSGNWSKLNEEYLQEYISTHKISNCDKVILKSIEDFKTL